MPQRLESLLKFDVPAPTTCQSDIICI